MEYHKLPEMSRLLLSILLLNLMLPVLGAAECDNWETKHPEWIFCDDFEDSSSLVRDGRYSEYDNNDGDFTVMNVGLEESLGMRALWQQGEVGAGSILLGFGRNPSGYMNKGIRQNEDFREIYYRMYLKWQKGWQGNPAKLSRATVIARDDWSQAMIAHLWGGSGNRLTLDPVRCVDQSNNVRCSGYNDFGSMDWLGINNGVTPIFSSGYDDKWYCIEHHVKLNDPGQSNGLNEFWIDGSLEARSQNLNFVRSYTDYGINAVLFENYWNDGSPKQQERYFDNIVVSTESIGCDVQPSPQCITGDLNCDGVVNIFDLVLVAQDFGKSNGFDPRADPNSDGKIDIFDLVLVAQNFGSSG